MEAAPRELHGRFWLEDLLVDAGDCGVNRFILVQTHSSARETREYLSVARANEVIAGVIGWLDLTSGSVSDDLATLRSEFGGEYMVGVRHQVEDEPDPGWLTRPDVRAGLAALEGSGLVFDLLVRTQHLEAAADAVMRHPGIEFVVDHLAKPPIRNGEMATWEARLRTLGKYPNVHAKISGLGSRATEGPGFSRRIQNVVEIALDAFGPKRLVFGSDWPIAKAMDAYPGVVAKTRDSLRALGMSATEVTEVFVNNTERTYSLPVNPQVPTYPASWPERKDQ